MCSGYIITPWPNTESFLGVYFGYPKSPKYRVWIAEMNSTQLKSIEGSCKSAVELAKKLFRFVFKNDLETRPDDICATSNRLDGRTLCDQDKLRGIRCEFK